MNATTFQPFVLYTAAAGVYVVAAFVIDFIFRTIEKALTTPPSGRLANLLQAPPHGAGRAGGAARRGPIRQGVSSS